MLSLLHWKNKPVLTLLDSLLLLSYKAILLSKFALSTLVSTSKLWQFGIHCHDSIKATNVLVLPNPEALRNSKCVPLPTGSLELSPYPLWHRPLKLSSPSWLSSHATDHTSSVFITDPSSALLVNVSIPKGQSAVFFFFLNFHTFLLVSSNVHNLNYFPCLLPSGPLPHPMHLGHIVKT